MTTYCDGGLDIYEVTIYKNFAKFIFDFSKNCTINDCLSAACLYESGAYSRAALISMGKTLKGIWRELREACTWYARFSIKIHLELLYEPINS